jgi:hypothetical protein
MAAASLPAFVQGMCASAKQMSRQPQRLHARHARPLSAKTRAMKRVHSTSASQSRSALASISTRTVVRMSACGTAKRLSIHAAVHPSFPNPLSPTHPHPHPPHIKHTWSGDHQVASTRYRAPQSLPLVRHQAAGLQLHATMRQHLMRLRAHLRVDTHFAGT